MHAGASHCRPNERVVVATNPAWPPIANTCARCAGRLRHDGNPVLEWCVGNMVGREHRRGSAYPTRQRPEQKINAAAVAMIMVVAMSDEGASPGLDALLANPVLVRSLAPG